LGEGKPMDMNRLHMPGASVLIDHIGSHRKGVMKTIQIRDAKACFDPLVQLPH
jgi:hypothetical protein